MRKKLNIPILCNVNEIASTPLPTRERKAQKVLTRSAASSGLLTLQRSTTNVNR